MVVLSPCWRGGRIGRHLAIIASHIYHASVHATTYCETNPSINPLWFLAATVLQAETIHGYKCRCNGVN